MVRDRAEWKIEIKSGKRVGKEWMKTTHFIFFKSTDSGFANMERRCINVVKRRYLTRPVLFWSMPWSRSQNLMALERYSFFAPAQTYNLRMFAVVIL